MVEVINVTDRVISVVVFKEDVLRLIYWYTPQGGRSSEEKQSFYDELKCEWDMHSADYLVMCLSDLNGYVGRHIDGFDRVHGGYGVGQRKNVIRVLSGEKIINATYMV